MKNKPLPKFYKLIKFAFFYIYSPKTCRLIHLLKKKIISDMSADIFKGNNYSMPSNSNDTPHKFRKKLRINNIRPN